MRVSYLALFTALSACSGGSKDTSTLDTSGPFPTGSTPPTETADTAPEVDLTHGAFELTYGFDGFPAGTTTCADVGTTSLWLDRSIDGSVKPTLELPCDDAPILLAAEEEGTWVLTVRTVAATFDAEGVYGESYAVFVDAVAGELTSTYVPIVCDANDVAGGCD